MTFRRFFRKFQGDISSEKALECPNLDIKDIFKPTITQICQFFKTNNLLIQQVSKQGSAYKRSIKNKSKNNIKLPKLRNEYLLWSCTTSHHNSNKFVKSFPLISFLNRKRREYFCYKENPSLVVIPPKNK